ncbi:MAG: integration host factor subunit beta [Sulfuritalea sp.]|jgi:integration host factor subunit beta|nr:integration host factor subunit beta [Sulfuritalea sp.]
MTRSELVAELSARFPQLQIKDAALSVTVILDTITNSLINGDRAEIRGFWSFSLSYRQPRIGRNPRSGDRVEVPAKWTPHFKAGQELRQRVDILRGRSIETTEKAIR